MSRTALPLAIALGGLAGTFLRYAVSGWLPAAGAALPRATLLVNLAGSLVLGFVLRVAWLAPERAPSLRAGLAVGFCGAFTTMSTFAFESVRLLAERAWGTAALYLLLTVAGSIAAAGLGYLLGARV